MNNVHTKTPPPFSFKPEEWEAWKRDFLRFRNMTRLSKEPGDVQRDSLLYYMGTVQAEEVMATFTWGKTRITDPNDATATIEVDETDEMFDILVGKFQGYFVPQANIINESTVFNTRIQGEKESVDVFARDLQKLVITCEYSDPQRMVRDRFVAGLRDRKLQEKLQFKKDLTLESALENARRYEMVKRQVSEQQEKRVVADEVKERVVDEVKPNQYVSRGRGRGHYSNSRSQRGRYSNSQGQRQQDECENCGYSHPSRPCPARNKECLYCHTRGHLIRMCRKRLSADSRAQAQGVVEESEENFYVGMVTCEDDNEAWTVPLHIHNKIIDFKIDTGADVTIIPNSVYKSIPSRPELRRTRASNLNSPGGRLSVLGEFQARTNIKGKTYEFRIVVVENYTNCLLSRGTASRMNLIQLVEEISEEVFGSCGLMKTPPVTITLKQNARPHCVTTCRRIPFPIMSKVKAELDNMEKAGIISKVTQPTDFCSPIVPVLKKNGRVRICIDLKKLNASVKRPHYMLPNLDDISPHLKGSQYFSTLDAASGFLQIPLDKKSALLTTFITPFGRYCCNRVPFGITSGPEEFQRKSTELLQGLEGVHVIMDDILVHGKTIEEHDARLAAVVQRIQRSGLKLNKDKCQIRKTELVYFGHSVGRDGVKPQAEKVKAIQQLPPPTSVTELRTALGMINYLTKFTPGLASMIKPLTDLLKAEAVWQWGPSQQAAFKDIKEAIANTHLLAFYDPKRPTVVSADASGYGLGAALMQQTDEGLAPIAFASRTLTPAEARYAQIEKECLASVWACEKFARYLVGLHTFKLLTDHKPLVPLMTTKDLDQAPIRCQRLLMRLQRFNPDVIHVPGKSLVIADALSRHPLPHTNSDEAATEDITEHVEAIQALWPVSASRLDVIKAATIADEELMQVHQFIKFGWPQHIPGEAEKYAPFKAELSAVDGLLVYRDRIVIPAKLRSDMLDRLHESHQGVNKCLDNARSCMWWPGMTSEVKTIIDNCLECREQRPSQRKEPLQPTEMPARPWERVSADLCELKGKYYLIAIDQYSRWIEIKALTSITTSAVVQRFKDIIASHGIMDSVMTDNGPQFASQEFKDFADKYGFRHVTSSPHHHQANGEAEIAVKIAKKILSQQDPHLALLNYRASKHSSIGVTPAECLLGRRLQTRLPALAKCLVPRTVNHELLHATDTQAKASQKQYYDNRHGVRELPPLSVGQPVLLKLDTQDGWNKVGTVARTQHDNRTYLVDTPSGTLRRNRRHLQAVPALPTQPMEPEDPEDPPDTSPVAGLPPSHIPTAAVATPQGLPRPESHQQRPLMPRRSVRDAKPPSRLIENC